MGKRATFTQAELARAAATAKAGGVRITLRRGDCIAVVDPAPTTVGSSPDTADSALEAWLGGRDEGAA
jgi:hypothetical protein